MKRSLIVFGEDWGGLPSSTQHLIRHLKEERQVVWINSIGLRRPNISFRDARRIWQKLTARNTQPAPAMAATTENEPNLTVIHPKTLPAPRCQLERKLARVLLKRQIHPTLQRLGIENPILWTSLPTAVDMAGHLGDTSLVYYCGDDFSALAGVDHDTVASREQELMDKADLIVAASDKLVQKFPESTTRLLPHGVDYHRFATPVARADDLPDDGKITVGFYGSLSNWLDIDLLVAVISRLSDVRFLLIGNIETDVSRVLALPNVMHLGPRPHSALPGYSQHWHIAMLPFLDNAQIRSCNPLKLREYLATGRPVVSTPFPALMPYKDHVAVATTTDDWVNAILASANAPSSPDRQALVREHTWQARAHLLSGWLDAL